MSGIGDRKQFWAGLLFFVIGLGALWQLPSGIGTATAMGPGYFPMLLGLCLVVFGASSMVLGVRSAETVAVERLPVVTLLRIIGAVILFALLMTNVGLAVSLACLVGIACLPRLRQRPLEVLVIYLVLLALTWFVFIYIVQLPMDLW